MLNKITVLSALSLTLLAGSGAAFAQAPAATAPKPATKAGMRSVTDILGRIQTGAGAGIRVVADSTIGSALVSLPSGDTTPENVEAQIAAVITELPKGTVWAKLYLPAATARAYKGDDLAEFAFAQSKLFGRVGDAPAGTVEVMGKNLPADKAQAVIDALDLKPVYLVTNPTMKAVGDGDMTQWATLTDEQKADFAKKEATKRLAMGPEAFGKEFSGYVAQQSAVMGQMFGQMSPEQREVYGKAIRDSFQNGVGMGGMMMWGGNGGRGGNGGQRPNRPQVTPQ
ncbi:MAG: hypothetical protein H7Y38_16205 [Armatimonadetes bacterium]|nr:hypothetical protein [Armatimonadota bacterium]